MISMTMIFLFVIGGILLVTMLGLGTFWLLIQLGVIAQKAMEPPTSDSGNYSLEQGREAGRNEDSN
jgi:hypothetical protein